MTNNQITATAATLSLAVDAANAEIGTLNQRLADMEAAADLATVGAEEVVILTPDAAPNYILPTRGTALAAATLGRPEARHGVVSKASTFVDAERGGTLHLKALTAVMYGGPALAIGDRFATDLLFVRASDLNKFFNYSSAQSAARGRDRLAWLLVRHGSPKKATHYTLGLAFFQGACSRLVWEGGKVARHSIAVEFNQVQPV
jgi:hypothetical protein